MFHENGTTVVQKRMSFLGVAIVGVTAVIVTTIVSASGIAIYAFRVVDKKSDTLIGLAGNAIEVLPDYQAALPPALADAIDDVRSPDYLTNLRISVRYAAGEGRHSHHRAVVEVENLGEEVVSLLSMRVVGLDDSDEPICERNTWVATPLQLEHDWRGPLLPHSTRRFAVHGFDRYEIAELVHEVTDIRIWNRGGSKPAAKTAPGQTSASAADSNEDTGGTPVPQEEQYAGES